MDHLSTQLAPKVLTRLRTLVGQAQTAQQMAQLSNTVAQEALNTALEAMGYDVETQRPSVDLATGAITLPEAPAVAEVAESNGHDPLSEKILAMAPRG